MPTTQPTATGPNAFTDAPEVQQCLAQLREHFHAQNPLVVSDVLDEHGNQYVNLVQKGGGVLGVALVGYTYVLEQMGIRFLRLAGTSAGAINTAMMTVIDRKEDAKSEKIVKAISELDFFALVDGHPSARWLIKNFITHKDFTTKIKRWIVRTVALLFALIVADSALLSLEHHYRWLIPWTQTCFVITGFALLALGGLLFYLNRLMNRLKNAGFGINPGDFFYDWIKSRFKENDVHNVSDLNKKAGQPIPGLHLRVEHPNGTTNLNGDVTFIASELASGNKIQFPKMCNLFREQHQIDSLQPAGFVRASMAIPIFFESYFIDNIPIKSPEIKDAWIQTFNERHPPMNARFVDGGLLSNFPINLFFNPHMLVPRLPTFGIDLNDAGEKTSSGSTDDWGLFGYFGSMLNTLRGYYDKDFLVQNKAYEGGIGTINLQGFNWLNFFLSTENKKDMFVLGAQAATQFLLHFDWEDYKTKQTAMRKEIARN
jgi:NTE family protein